MTIRNMTQILNNDYKKSPWALYLSKATTLMRLTMYMMLYYFDSCLVNFLVIDHKLFTPDTMKIQTN